MQNSGPKLMLVLKCWYRRQPDRDYLSFVGKSSVDSCLQQVITATKVASCGALEADDPQCWLART
jgi:hypothetical protein